MFETYLLDTSALLALADRESGTERVRSLLQAARREEIVLYACFVSLTEFQYIVTYDRGAEQARRLVAALRKFPIAWLHSGAALCASAAEFKASHRISLGDAFVAAAALRVNAVLVHKDPEFAALPSSIRQESLPLKSSPPTSS
jgi:predicted nucleic acid-binding protein